MHYSLIIHQHYLRVNSVTHSPRTLPHEKIPGISIGGGVPAQPTVEMLSLDNATAFLRQEYPASAYTIISVNVTDRYGSRNLYEFRIQKTGSVPGDTGFSAFVDAKTGDPYTPGQDSAKITADRAKLLIKEAFFMQNTDTVRVRYDYNPESVRAWIFSVNHDNTAILTGILDPETGQLLSFSRNISWEGRQADPLLDISAAQKIADRYIIDKNRGPLPVNMSEGQYYPLQVPQKTVAGHYVFVYTRIIQGIPCDSDGYHHFCRFNKRGGYWIRSPLELSRQRVFSGRGSPCDTI